MLPTFQKSDPLWTMLCMGWGSVHPERCSLRGVSCADVVEALGSQHVLSTPSSLSIYAR